MSGWFYVIKSVIHISKINTLKSFYYAYIYCITKGKLLNKFIYTQY
jgi:hypothetical protein